VAKGKELTRLTTPLISQDSCGGKKSSYRYLEVLLVTYIASCHYKHGWRALCKWRNWITFYI